MAMPFYKVRMTYDDGYSEVSEYETFGQMERAHGFHDGRHPALYPGERMTVWYVDSSGRSRLVYVLTYRACVECSNAPEDSDCQHFVSLDPDYSAT